MSVKIYHNPRCSKSRQTLEIIRAAGIEPQIIEYLKTPPTGADIANMIDELGLEDPREMMRRQEEPYKTLNLAAPGKDGEALVAAMAENPILIERPVVITAKGARICRPPERVKEIL